VGAHGERQVQPKEGVKPGAAVRVLPVRLLLLYDALLTALLLWLILYGLVAVGMHGQRQVWPKEGVKPCGAVRVL
jgi:hypothetical protein